MNVLFLRSDVINALKRLIPEAVREWRYRAYDKFTPPTFDLDRQGISPTIENSLLVWGDSKQKWHGPSILIDGPLSRGEYYTRGLRPVYSSISSR
jgi:hypothetical protein